MALCVAKLEKIQVGMNRRCQSAWPNPFFCLHTRVLLYIVLGFSARKSCNQCMDRCSHAGALEPYAGILKIM